MTQNEKMQINKNCLNLIRLLAAFQVMCSHTLIHLQIEVPNFISGVINIFRGVPIFFGISGFLIWFSLDRTETVGVYLRKRFLRIYPELWMGVTVEVIVLFILYGVKDIKEFILFVVGQATIFQFWTPDSLRAYGCGTPNGSLWTIGVIVQFYVLVWWMYKFLHNKSAKKWLGAWMAMVLVGKLLEELLQQCAPIIVSKLYDMTVLRYLWLFVIGGFLAEFSKKILPYLKKYWLVFAIIVWCLYMTGIDVEIGYGILYSISLILAVVGFAYAFPKLEIQRDISYGIYLFHMTIINAMIMLGLQGEMMYLVVTVSLSCILAFASSEVMNKIKHRKL